MVVTQNFFVGFRDVDINSKMKNSSILNVFQEVAGIHSIEIGKKFNGLDSTWILTGYKVNIIKRPVYGDNIEVSTWGTEIKSVTAVREFEIKNSSGELLVTGISNWAHLSNNRLAKVPEETVKAYGLEPDHTNYNELKLKKISEPEKYSIEKEYMVDWNWIDVNRHMNNIYYMDLAEMIIPEEHKLDTCESFEVSYKKEVKYGEKVKFYYSDDNDSKIIVVKNEDLTDVCAIIKLD